MRPRANMNRWLREKLCLYLKMSLYHRVHKQSLTELQGFIEDFKEQDSSR
jgi:hypothetical protein